MPVQVLWMVSGFALEQATKPNAQTSAIIIAIMALGTALMTVRFFKTVKGREIQMLSVASEAISV